MEKDLVLEIMKDDTLKDEVVEKFRLLCGGDDTEEKKKRGRRRLLGPPPSLK